MDLVGQVAIVTGAVRGPRSRRRAHCMVTGDTIAINGGTVML
jgi:hypothetical protein